jgi:hypothetical protein
MARQPVAGWTIDVAALGLPAGSRIESSSNATYSSPFVGAVGNRGFFLAGTPAADGSSAVQWWLTGVDVDSGRILFPATDLGVGDRAPHCLLNGPDAVLCLLEDVQNSVLLGSTAQVIDSHTGTIRFTGRTPIAIGGRYQIQQVGIYAVAASVREGIFGVGPSADLSWFVPGDGRVLCDQTSDITEEPTRTSQDAAGDRKVVFSVENGIVISPQMGADLEVIDAMVYSEGMALRVSSGGPRSKVLFFDADGKQLGSADVEGQFARHLPGLPIVQTPSGAVVFSPRGDELARITGYHDDTAFLVGTTLYASSASIYEKGWRAVDLATGRADLPDCEKRLDGFLASDGTVGVFKRSDMNAGLVVEGVDLKRCAVAWSTSAPVGSLHDVWRIGTTLVSLSDDGTEVSSLVSGN